MRQSSLWNYSRCDNANDDILMRQNEYNSNEIHVINYVTYISIS